MIEVNWLLFAGSARKRPARMFFDGALSNICNPKIAVFYLALLPQFVAPGATHATLHVSPTSEARTALQTRMERVIEPTDGMAEFDWVI